MRQFAGLWYPAGDPLTKAFKARLQTEEFYRADRFHDAMKHVSAWRGAIDCGAHVGAWSRALAGRFEHVVAIEANPASAQCLRANVAGRGNVTVLQCALGSQPGGHSGIGGGKGSIGAAIVAGDAVQMSALDAVLDGIDLPYVDYLKIHVNGGELDVLKGARETIRFHQPVLTVVIKRALANYGATPEQVFEFMDGIGYGVVSRLKPYFVFAPGA